MINAETMALVDKKLKVKMEKQVELEMQRLEAGFKELSDANPEVSKEILFRVFALSHIATLYAVSHKEVIADEICKEIFEGVKNA